MPPRKILPATHPKLREAAQPADLSDGVPAPIFDLANDLMETCTIAGGAGIAATQVGAMVRVFVMRLARQGYNNMAFINPEIVWRSENIVRNTEGCLSMPDIYFEVERPAEVKIKYFDINGVEQEYHATGPAAIVTQHEIDHLDGIRHVDRVGPLMRKRMLEKFTRGQKKLPARKTA